MNKALTFTIRAAFLLGCTGDPRSESLYPATITQVNKLDLTSAPAEWNIYDSDPEHLWN